MTIYKVYDIQSNSETLYISIIGAKEGLWRLYCESNFYKEDNDEVKAGAEYQLDREWRIDDVGEISEVEVY